MPKEILEKAITVLKEKEYICWHKKKIFGLWDILAINNKGLLLILLTTEPKVQKAKKRIQEFCKNNNISIYSEIWFWSAKNEKFKILSVY